jgi:fructuronate reductase
VTTTRPAGQAPIVREPLSRAALARRTGRPADPAPVRIAHLGLGAFHRAHQAWYTHAADPAGEWGIAAFTGRRPDAALELAAQDSLFTLIERSAEGDDLSVIASISRAIDGGDLTRLVETVASPETSVVTLTITEAGYTLDAGGRPEGSDPAVAADREWLRHALGAAVINGTQGPRTALARLLTALEVRRRMDGGPVAIVSCDNLPANGALLRSGLLALAESSPGTVDYLRSEVSFVSTSVDRITPKTTTGDLETVAASTAWIDRAPVVTEPFHDWVLSGDFPAGRPEWERAGARFVDDVDPFERRKLWLLNGSHTLMAYAGAARGHRTVAEAIGDNAIRAWVQQFWDEAVPHLPSDAGLELDRYRAALLERFDNHRIEHLLSQIGQDGTNKLRVRIVPVLLAERAAGRDGAACVHALGAWVHAARAGTLPPDRSHDAIARAASEGGDRAVAGLLDLLEPSLSDHPHLVAEVVAASRGLD